MLIPQAPAAAHLERITPSIYDASADCLAKAVWYAFGGRGVLPEHPAAILGTSFHSVLAAAHRGQLVVASDTDRGPARKFFDETARVLHSRAHPLVRLKVLTSERLPYYNLHRERAALLATRIAYARSSVVNSSTGAATAAKPAGSQTESRLCSTDGLIIGRPDYIDRQRLTVVDYKSGYVTEGDGDVVSASEARQLRLYAYLAVENGIPVIQGTIIRGDGRRCELPISQADAAAEANNVRSRLQTLNAAISGGATFSSLASPSSKSCRSCPCIPFCDSFWAAAKPEWHSECGLHVEGNVLEADTRQVQGISLSTFLIEVRSGTVSSRNVSVEQIPSEWMTFDGDKSPQTGDFIRVVHGRLSAADESTSVIRVDKTTTTIWRVPPERGTASI